MSDSLEGKNKIYNEGECVRTIKLKSQALLKLIYFWANQPTQNFH